MLEASGWVMSNTEFGNDCNNKYDDDNDSCGTNNPPPCLPLPMPL